MNEELLIELYKSLSPTGLFDGVSYEQFRESIGDRSKFITFADSLEKDMQFFAKPSDKQTFIDQFYPIRKQPNKGKPAPTPLVGTEAFGNDPFNLVPTAEDAEDNSLFGQLGKNADAKAKQAEELVSKERTQQINENFDQVPVKFRNLAPQPYTLPEKEKQELHAKTRFQEAIEAGLQADQVTPKELFQFVYPDESSDAYNNINILERDLGKGLDEEGKINPYSIVRKYAVSQADVRYTPEELMAMKEGDLFGLTTKDFQKIKEYVSAHKTAEAAQKRKELELYNQFLATSQEKHIPREVFNASDVIEALAPKYESGEITEEEMATLQTASQVLQNLPDETKAHLQSIPKGASRVEQEIQDIDVNYPEVKIVEKLNQEIQRSYDDWYNSLGRGLSGNPATNIIAPVALKSLLNVAKAGVEVLPTLGNDLAATYDAVSGGLFGDEDAQANTIRRANAFIQPGTLIDASQQKRSIFEKTASVNHDGKRLEVGFDERGNVTKVYDSYGSEVYLPEEEFQKIQDQAPALYGEATSKFNNSAAFNAVTDGVRDLAVTMILSKGLGQAVKGTGGLATRVREGIPIMFQYTGKMAQEGINQGLSPDEALLYAGMQVGMESGTEMMFPFIGKLTGAGFNTKRALDRLISNPETLKQLSKKEFFDLAIKGPLGEGVEEATAAFLNPVVNQAFNELSDENLDTTAADWQEIGTSAALGLVIGALPGLVGGISRSKQVPSDSYLAQTIFAATDKENIQKATDLAKSFKTSEYDRMAQILQTTHDETKDIREAEGSETDKIKAVVAKFNEVKRRYDAVDSSGTVSSNKINQEADDLHQTYTEAANAVINPQPTGTDESPTEGVQTENLKEFPTDTEAEGEAVTGDADRGSTEPSVNPLQDVESTAKALSPMVELRLKMPKQEEKAVLGVLEGFKQFIPQEVFDRGYNDDKVSGEIISEEYHKAKSDGSNPELVKAVEDLLGVQKSSQESTTGTETGEDVNPQTGQPYKATLYHGVGTNSSPSDALYLGDKKLADTYSESGEVKEFQVSLENPYVVNTDTDFDLIDGFIQEFRSENPEANWHPETTGYINNKLRELGYDGLVITDKSLGSEKGYERIGGTYGDAQTVVFDPSKVEPINPTDSAQSRDIANRESQIEDSPSVNNAQETSPETEKVTERVITPSKTYEEGNAVEYNGEDWLVYKKYKDGYQLRRPKGKSWEYAGSQEESVQAKDITGKVTNTVNNPVEKPQKQRTTLASLTKTLQDVFNLPKAKAQWAARVVDLLITEMSKRPDINGVTRTKQEIYDMISFEIPSQEVYDELLKQARSMNNDPAQVVNGEVKGAMIDVKAARENNSKVLGALLAQDVQYVVYALTNPNVTTPIHEIVHVFERYLTPQERDTIIAAAKTTAYVNGKTVPAWTNATSEYFAKGFEQYLRSGIAPSPELKTLFEKFKAWLTEIYKSVHDLNGLTLSPQVTEIYKKMLGISDPKLLTQEEKKADDFLGELGIQLQQVERPLAPNGKPSNLSPGQWRQVRTPEFKAWFGDWENPNLVINGVDYTALFNRAGIPFRYLQELGGTGDKLTQNMRDSLSRSVNNAIKFWENAKAERQGKVKDSEREFDVQSRLLDKVDKRVSDLKELKKQIDDNLLRPSDIQIGTNASKVVDENGEPLVVYHGTPKGGNVEAFDNELLGSNSGNPTAMWGTAFTPNESYARGYRDGYIGDNKGLVAAFLSIKNPKNITYSDMRAFQDLTPPFEEQAMIAELEELRGKALAYKQEAIEDGFDGIYVVNSAKKHPVKSLRNLDEIFVFEPNQIKSATDNSGAFNPNDPRIQFQIVGEKGATNLDKGEEAANRLDNLEVAIAMEKAGEGVIPIRLATGWERGAEKSLFANRSSKDVIEFLTNEGIITKTPC